MASLAKVGALAQAIVHVGFLGKFEFFFENEGKYNILRNLD